jgi:hypothetical protein
VEILHTVLLGVIKYIWHNVNVYWNDLQRQTFVMRLQAADIDGLGIPPIRAGYMAQYRNSLIGKHFRVLMQLMSFQLHGLVDNNRFTMVKAAGQLGALLWIPQIRNMEEYMVSDISPSHSVTYRACIFSLTCMWP